MKIASLPVALVVTHDRYKNAQIKKTLKDYFHLVETPESFEAVEFLKHLQVSVIILDESTLSDTWELLVSHIRTLTGYAETPIILITTKLKKTFLLEALKMGVSDFLQEPLDVNEIYQRVLVSMKSTPTMKRITMLSKKIPRPKETFQLPQRFVVTEEAMQAIAKSRTNLQPLSLLMIELRISRTDSLTQAINRHLRTQDILLPQGGSRFLIILPNTSSRAAGIIAESLREEITALSKKKNSTSLTLSIGLASFDKKSEHALSVYDQFGELLEKVDRALTKAQQQGDNIVTE